MAVPKGSDEDGHDLEHPSEREEEDELRHAEGGPGEKDEDKEEGSQDEMKCLGAQPLGLDGSDHDPTGTAAEGRTALG